jgi:hypothetical protein
MSPPTIVSVGYGNPKARKDRRETGTHATNETIVSLVDRLGATLIDVRALPGPHTEREIIRHANGRTTWKNGRLIFSRLGFWPLDLAKRLGRERYEWHGETLGGVIQGFTGPTPAGLDMLERRVKRGEPLVYMCSESQPENCHRHHMIAVRTPEWCGEGPKMRGLTSRGIRVLHYFDGRAVKDAPPAERVEQFIEAVSYDRWAAGKAPEGYDFYPITEILR